MPVSFNITVGPLDDGSGRYLASVADSSDDVIGARAGTAEAAALRAVSLYLKVNDRDPSAAQVTVNNVYRAPERKPRVAVGPLSVRAILEDAIRNDTEVEITYTDTNNATTERTVEPFRFKDGREGELIECFDGLRGQVRNFRVDRISKAVMK